MVRLPIPKRRQAWRQQEGRLHQEGHRRVPGSGAGDSKGDNRGRNFLIEAKTTAKSQRPLSLAEFAKCERNARKEDRLPAMQIQLKDQERFAVIRWADFEALIEAAGWEI